GWISAPVLLASHLGSSLARSKVQDPSGCAVPTDVAAMQSSAGGLLGSKLTGSSVLSTQASRLGVEPGAVWLYSVLCCVGVTGRSVTGPRVGRGPPGSALSSRWM